MKGLALPTRNPAFYIGQDPPPTSGPNLHRNLCKKRKPELRMGRVLGRGFLVFKAAAQERERFPRVGTPKLIYLGK